ncbi:MAG: exo-alpha-sialidase [Deferribacteres bacterium]|nr:exo-alpha-sialidase [candidate division KSB1 bacterium]MCB9500611.1 exo-alpha-sialidase [Deferribacteres bacterium]
MRKKLFIIFAIQFILGCTQNDKSGIAPGVISHEDLFNTGMRPGVSCFRIPALVTAPNGDLLAVMDERVESCSDLHKNGDINIVARRSADNGRTWSEIETVVDYPNGQSASDASMVVDKQTGEIFLFYNYMDLENEPGIYALHVMKSTDNGQSWSTPSDFTSQIAKPEWRTDFKFITSGRGIQTRSGMLLHTLVNLNNGLHVFGSRDHGQTWFLLETSIEPADESKIVELADGSWMINSRLNKSGMRYVHRSTDFGTSWQTVADSALIDPGCNASLIRYTSVQDGFKKNRLLFSNAQSKTDRENMSIRISYDEGKTWSDGKTIFSGHSAYSSLTILENGDIGLFFEKDDHTKNVFVRFSLEWLTDGEDKYENPVFE